MTVILQPQTNPARVRHLLLGRANWSDAATLGGSSAFPGTRLANLKEAQPTELYATTPTSTMFLTADRGGPYAFNVVSLLYTNATEAATWRVRAGSANGTWDAFDSGVLPIWPQPSLHSWGYAHAFLFVPDGITARWVRIDMSDAANPFDFFYIGRLFISYMWQPTFNYDYGIRIGHVGSSQKRRMPGSQTRRLVRRPIPFLEWTIRMLGRDEMLSQAHKLEREAGDAGDVLVVADPGDSLHLQELMVYGTVEDFQAINMMTQDRFEKTWRVEALL